jgi:type II secretory ATPase GspE/PulE/Tfp pilus assembly ATPase PilB-like protein
VILIGEIRDSESAVIALEAALTGHLVLTSLHTDTEIQAINRFKQFGIPLPLVASALHLIVSQRLIRTICGSCNGTGAMDSAHICERCGGSGYHGRTGMFRVLPISDVLRGAIQGEQYGDMARIIHETAASLEAAGRVLIDTGRSTREEMLRVLGSEGGFNE